MSLFPVIILLFAPPSVSAKESQSEFSFRGGPLAQCREFMILETTLYQTSLARTESERDSGEGGYLCWEFGAMVNTTPRDAWGASVYFALERSTARFGLLPRYRRWLSPRIASDVSAGVFFWDTHDAAPSQFPGALARYELHFADLLSASAQIDGVRRGSVWQGRVYAGLRVGSYAAVPMFLVNIASAGRAGDSVFHPASSLP